MTVTFQLDQLEKYEKMIAIEGMLQHYGLKTRYLDLVDNHWVALWMGLNSYKTTRQLSKYAYYVKREMPYPELINGHVEDKDIIYQYIILLAFPYSNYKVKNGISRCGQYVIVDLRQALPATLLRPHAQHGLLVRKIQNSPNYLDYDLAETIVGIIRMRIDRVAEWLGNGTLLTQENLFPSPAQDGGYDILLSREDLFPNPQQRIVKFA